MGSRSPALTLLTGMAGLLWVGFALRAAASAADAPDVRRQWVVCQYVLAGHDPYALARDALRESLGPPDDFRTFTREIPQDVSPELQARLLEGLGPPEATYPPPAVALFSLTIGLLPVGLLVPGWTLVNTLAMLFLILQLASDYPPRADLPPVLAACFVAWFALLYHPCFRAVAACQFVLPVFSALLHATRPGSNPYSGGLTLALALIKPSVALPFVVLVVKQRRWLLLVVAASLQLAGWLGLAAWLDSSPLVLLREWLMVGPYFMISTFGVQPLLVNLGWVGKP